MPSQDSTFDAWLDTQLRAVPVPPGMLERLRQIPRAGDEALDAAVRGVPVPLGLRRRLEQIGRTRVRMARLGEMAIATALVVAIGVCYVGGMLAFLLTAYRSPGSPPARLISRVMVEMLPASDGNEPGFDDVQIAFVGREAFTRDVAEPTPEPPEFHLVSYGEPAYSPLLETLRLFAGLHNPAGWDPLEDPRLGEWPVFAAPSRRHELPELKRSLGLVRRGVAIPPVDGADPAFLIRTGFNPFISPAGYTELQSSVVPLGSDSRSYDLAREHLQRGRMLPAKLLRTEDFLAAVDYEFPEPKNQPLGLHVAGGPSPFSFGRPRLLQIGVQARDVPDGDRPGAHLTLAVDVSASMRESGGLEMARRAICELVSRMGPQDRISLVAFGEDAYVLAEDVGRGATDELQSAVQSLAAKGSTNLVAGLRQAYAVAYRRAQGDELPNRVILLTDSLAQLDPVTADRMAERLLAPVGRGILLHVIEMGDASTDVGASRVLENLAQTGGGRVHRATNCDQVCWALREVLTGKSQLVAFDVRLKVTFNPQSVAAYRLLGHEVGDLPADPESDFYAGQAATALYEVQLRPNAEKEVAVVELSWRDPAGGQPGSATRKFRRGQFARSMIDAPLSVQAAAVVAEAVEILRGSPFVEPRPDPWSLAPVLEHARQVDTRVREHPTFADFILVMEQAEVARSHRSGGRG